MASLGLICRIALCGLLLSQPAQAALRACVAESDFPPFSYKLAGKTEVAGFTPTLLRRLLALSNLGGVEIEPLPWRRCLVLAANGQFQLVLDVPTAQVDPAPYLVSEPYFNVHSNYYYSSKRWPGGLQIGRLEQLGEHTVCGLLGNTFDGYGLDARRVDTGATSYPQLIAKLHAGRCDLFIEKREVVAGISLLDKQTAKLFGDPLLRSAAVPEDSPLGLHFLISRKASNAQNLLKSLNQGLQEMSKRKELEQLAADYFKSTSP